MLLEADPTLRRRIELQGGVFTRADLLACGHRDAQLRSWHRAGLVLPVGRGAYALAVTGADVHATAREQERRRIRAMLLLSPSTDVASHRSALALHQVPLLDDGADEPVHLTRLGPWSSRSRQGLHLHRAVPGTVVQGRSVSMADAVVQHATRTGLQSGVVSADGAMQSRLASRDDLAAAAARMRGRRGAGVLPALLALADGRSESPGETLLRLICVDAGIAVRPQVEIRDGGFMARVDLLVEGSNVVLELDGLLKYRADPDALVREKRREHRLHQLGYRVLHVTWAELFQPDRLVARIRGHLPGHRGRS